jgi:hypothetical protein
MGREGTAALILKFGTTWRSVVGFTSRLIYLCEKSHQVPSEYLAEWPQNPVLNFDISDAEL